MPSINWPELEASEKEIKEQEKATFHLDDALAQASEQILEVRILSNESEITSIQNNQLPEGASQFWQAKTARLDNVRRTFVIEEREEEKMENKGVHLRNRWMTFLALAWQ
jgi:hypothetical protein